jgi:Family of unknown function (DUF5689)
MKKYFGVFITVLLLGAFSACVKEKFNAPANTNTDPNIAVNFSIDSVKGRFVNQGNQPYQFTQDLVISAVVSADDRSGNLYKELAIQDSTGGILLMLAGYDLYNTYPVGRRLFISLKGLWVVQYDGAYELVNNIDSVGGFVGIPPTLYHTYITPGKFGVPVMPIDLPINLLNNNLQGELIQLDGVQFTGVPAGSTYANDSSLANGTWTLSDCSANTIAVYTSGYANFAGSVVPTGNGKLLAIYSVYNGTPQLIIRDTTDVNLKGTRCP